MTDSRSEIEATARRLVEYWPVVLVAVIVAAALAVGYAYMTTPRTLYQATAVVRLVELGDNVRGATVDGLAAAAISREAKAAVVESMGPEAAAGIDSIKSAIDPKDGSLVRVVVRGADPSRTRAFAEALARTAVRVEQESFDPVAGAYESVAAHNSAVAEKFEQQIAKLQALASENPKDASIQLALVTAQAQQEAARDNATLNKP